MKINNVFKNEKFGTLEVVEDEEKNPWFFAKNVCDALGLENVSQALRNLEPYEKVIASNVESKRGGARYTTFINESGLYSLIFASRKAEAKEFKRWVTSVVLPSIRQNGGYVEGQEDLEREDYYDLCNEIGELKRNIAALTDQNLKEHDARKKMEDYLRKEDKFYTDLVEELAAVYEETEDYRKELMKNRIEGLKVRRSENEVVERQPIFDMQVIVCDAFGNITTRRNVLESDWE